MPPEAEETVRENNLVETSIVVSDRRSKVLVVDHAARWDLRFIDHAIRRDTGFEPTVLLTSTLTAAVAPIKHDPCISCQTSQANQYQA